MIEYIEDEKKWFSPRLVIRYHRIIVVIEGLDACLCHGMYTSENGIDVIDEAEPVFRDPMLRHIKRRGIIYVKCIVVTLVR